MQCSTYNKYLHQVHNTMWSPIMWPWHHSHLGSSGVNLDALLGTMPNLVTL